MAVRTDEETPGERCYRLRRRAGLGQSALADAAGVSISTISRFERGERDIPSGALVRIATALAVTPNYLLGYPEGDTRVFSSGEHLGAAA